MFSSGSENCTGVKVKQLNRKDYSISLDAVNDVLVDHVH